MVGKFPGVGIKIAFKKLGKATLAPILYRWKKQKIQMLNHIFKSNIETRILISNLKFFHIDHSSDMMHHLLLD